MAEEKKKIMRCSSCNTAYNVASLKPWVNVKCRKCGTINTVPAEEIVVPTPEPVLVEEAAPPSPPKVAETTVRAEKRKCPFCAEEIQAEAVKCKHCGSDLTQPVSKPKLPKEAPPTEKKKTDTLGILLLLTPVAGVVWMILVVGNVALMNAENVLVTGLFLVPMASAVLVGFDTAGINQRSASEREESVTIWILGMVLFWVIFYPWWMSRRAQYPNTKKFGIGAILLTTLFLLISFGMIVHLGEELKQIRRLFR